MRILKLVDFDAPFMFFDQFPVALTGDGSGRIALIAIVRRVPVDPGRQRYA